MAVYTHFEIREVDAYMYDEDWCYNTTYRIGTFKTRSKDPKRAFLNALNKFRIEFKIPIKIVDDSEILEIVSKETLEPLYVAVPVHFSLD